MGDGFIVNAIVGTYSNTEWTIAIKSPDKQYFGHMNGITDGVTDGKPNVEFGIVF